MDAPTRAADENVGPKPPLHQVLRAHTATAHARLDAGLGAGFRDARDYAAYLAGMAAFLDAAQGVLGDEDWLEGARNAIAQDLGRAPPRTGHLRDAQDTATLAGWRYVVAGSSLGARVLLREAGRLAAAATRGTAPLRTTFLSSFAAGDAWPRCLDELRNARFDAAGQARACDAALEAFHAAEAAMIQARNTLHAA